MKGNLWQPSVQPCLPHTMFNLEFIKDNSSSGLGVYCRYQHMRALHQAVPRNHLLQARSAMTSHQIAMTVCNKRSGGSAVKAGCQSLGLTRPMATVQRPVDGADITCWPSFWDSCLLRWMIWQSDNFADEERSFVHLWWWPRCQRAIAKTCVPARTHY